MSARKQQKRHPLRFEMGHRGACEAILFEFHDDRPTEAGESSIRIAARTFDEAFDCLRSHEPKFNINRVQSLGVIVIASGSPVD
jgi:hypothetical protein